VCVKPQEALKRRRRPLLAAAHPYEDTSLIVGETCRVRQLRQPIRILPFDRHSPKHHHLEPDHFVEEPWFLKAGVGETIEHAIDTCGQCLNDADVLASAHPLQHPDQLPVPGRGQHVKP